MARQRAKYTSRVMGGIFTTVDFLLTTSATSGFRQSGLGTLLRAFRRLRSHSLPRQYCSLCPLVPHTWTTEALDGRPSKQKTTNLGRPSHIDRMALTGVLSAFYVELALLGMIFSGTVLRFSGVFKLPALVALNKFVFYICLMCTVFKSIGNTGVRWFCWILKY